MSVETFPWPFEKDTYRYSANLEPAPARRETAASHWGEHLLDVDEHYLAELAAKRVAMSAGPPRHVVLPHMLPACWETLLVLLEELATSWPDRFALQRDGRRLHWTNRLLDLQLDIDVGDPDVEPLALAASQVQEDIALLDQREGDLFLDAGAVAFASNWSLAFDIGMRLLDVHGPVPRDYADGAVVRARDFMLGLEAGQAYRRLNWSSTVGTRLDTSLETYHRWGAERAAVARAADDELDLSLRVEVQHVFRLPQTQAVVFLIRTHLLGIEEIARVPPWAAQLAAVLSELPEDMLAYKGFAPVKDRVLARLSRS